jgi:hypothetical protein
VAFPEKLIDVDPPDAPPPIVSSLLVLEKSAGHVLDVPDT